MTGSCIRARYIMSRSTSSKASRATTSGSRRTCPRSAASSHSKRRAGRSLGSKRCCGCAKASAFPATGQSTTRMTCSGASSDFKRLTKRENATVRGVVSAYCKVCDKPGTALRPYIASGREEFEPLISSKSVSPAHAALIVAALLFSSSIFAASLSLGAGRP